MSYSEKELWLPKFKSLQELLKKGSSITEIKEILRYLHGQLHASDVYDGEFGQTYYDELASEICPENFNICPTARNMTVAWNIWHITRIEDLTTSVFLCSYKQVIDDFTDAIGTSARDTGNVMTDEEIFSLGRQLDIKALLEYRSKVGSKTKAFIDLIDEKELKRKFTAQQTERIQKEGGVVNGSEWLAEFWGRKNVSGIITMPMTKHQLLHINDCRNIIQHFNNQKAKEKRK